MEFILDFILHIDQYMISIVQDYHTWAYAIPVSYTHLMYHESASTTRPAKLSLPDCA